MDVNLVIVFQKEQEMATQRNQVKLITVDAQTLCLNTQEIYFLHAYMTIFKLDIQHTKRATLIMLRYVALEFCDRSAGT